MIRFVLTVVFLALSQPAMAEIKITEVTSPGGIKAWLVEEHQIPFVALELRFRGGTSLDAEGKRGATTLMTSLLEEGAGTLDATGFAQAREALAAEIKFDADADGIAVSAQFLTENRGKGVDLLRLALTDPAFDQPSIDRVKGQIQSLIQSHDTSPDQIADESFARAIMGDHPYASSELGTAQSVAALTRDDLFAAKAAGMALDRVYVSAAGDITADELGALLDHLLGGLPAEGAPMPPRAMPVFSGQTSYVDFDSPQSVVRFGQAGLAADDPDFFAAYLLNQILGGGGFSARLMTEVREKRGLTYGIYASLVPMDLADLWQGSFSASTDKVAEAVKLVKEVWADVAANGVTETQLDAAKTYLTGAYPLRFDGNSTIAAILVGMQVMGYPSDYPATRNQRVEAVTLADVNRVARERLTPDALSFVVVGRPLTAASSP
ncbi:MAG: pitrilysin family protein [Paracoccaceae bacterium]